MPADEGYQGEARLASDALELAVFVRLAGRFDPISGSYRWYGRIDSDPAVTALAESGVRRVTLRTPEGEAATGLSDVDPWGRYRVEGFGRPPFAVAVLRE